MQLADTFAQNRTEELPDDLWGKYVLPLDYSRFNLRNFTKSSIIVGGRGSGKTMFLKYHCHPTMFSPNRSDISLDASKHIGLYWRPDLYFVSHFRKEWLGKQFLSHFNTYCAISVLKEISSFSLSFCRSGYPNQETKEMLRNLQVPKVICGQLGIPDCKLVDFGEHLDDLSFEFTSWANNPITRECPFTIDFKTSCTRLLEEIKKSDLAFSQSTFHIYIDEFENLTIPQQELVNTWIKHSSSPLVCNVAMKKHAIITRKTLGEESIVEVNDFRNLDLEDLYSSYFEVLAAEILCLKVANYFKQELFDGLVERYSSIDAIELRRDEKYHDIVKGFAYDIFPSVKNRDIAIEVLNTKSLRNKLVKGLIVEGLKLHSSEHYNASQFIDERYPEASVINGVLLNRARSSVSDILARFEHLQETGKLTSEYSNLIQNNLVGAILYIYNATPNSHCPFYSGFEKFTLMARGNLRHFLELCHQSFSRSIEPKSFNHESIMVSENIQAEATKETASAAIEKISDLGANGQQLKRVAKRLGSIFKASQRRKSQSEPEVSHFTVSVTDLSELDEKISGLINEALVWSVLFEGDSTKMKSNTDIELKDYILHPVFSAHFGISPRKKRKLTFTKAQIRTIFLGSDDEFLVLMKDFNNRWSVDLSNEESKNSNDLKQLGLSW
ncbi:hypothetical protein KUV89_12980 [Marinobacter hydrocarbonoclasticus]|nr:hypothetical protein [Marinobacter nauticus]